MTLAPVDVDAVELRLVALPLVAPFRSATTTETVREVVLVRVMGADGEGWGECVALTEPTYTSEYARGALRVLEQHLVPRLLATSEPLHPHDVVPMLATVDGHPMAKAALELAVLDMALRRASRSLADHLGGRGSRVPCGVALGLEHDERALLDTVERCLAEGYRRLKLKIAPGRDIAVVRAVRRHVGTDVVLQADANGTYTLEEAAALIALDEFDLACIEQPLGRDRLLDHAELASRMRTPVCLDESITSAGVAADAIRLGACSVLCIKPGRVGGYLAARAVHDVCIEHAVAAWCGGTIETGIGRSCNAALASLPGFTMPGDLSPSSRFFERDIVRQPPTMATDGTMAVPTAPGTGVEVDIDAVVDMTVIGPVSLRR